MAYIYKKTTYMTFLRGMWHLREYYEKVKAWKLTRFDFQVIPNYISYNY